ncbi:3-hydroxyacyl-CoA dehydrogenase family protein [Domibacillus robiginosus]|uniref:3-hydroxyacyl-CoA dehydrogenase family protein n=1 Tax=Domibacillus robiginosus TaxID=1071054 RepID=UPI00067AD2CA|nr:3-hydroxyacyl-CoA dehydrogenase family protein [Domibacillus robiginosus]
MNTFDERIAIIGAGTMGHSIALSAAMAGFEVMVWGVDEKNVENGKKGVLEKTAVLIENDLIQEVDKEAITGRIEFTVSLQECVRYASFIIECIPENLGMKQKMFQDLERLCGENTIIASNTSGLSPTDIAAYTNYPEKTLVTHFWNPGHLIPLVEVIKGTQTSDETAERALLLLHAMNKEPIIVKKDILGSIGNRLQYALFREAQFILEQGAADMEDIDKAAQYSIGRRLGVTGPFMSADMGGLDVFDSISTYLFPDLSKSDKSFPAMRNLVDTGRYGQKNGSGFYEWPEEMSQEMNKKREQELIDWLKKDKLSKQ